VVLIFTTLQYKQPKAPLSGFCTKMQKKNVKKCKLFANIIILLYLCIQKLQRHLMRSNEISLFLAFCIEQYKHLHNLTGEQSMRILDQYGVLEYLEAGYEPLHTQSAQWIMEDIDEFINKRKQCESITAV